MTACVAEWNLLPPRAPSTRRRRSGPPSWARRARLFTQSVSPEEHDSLFHAGKACRHRDSGQNENPRQEARDPNGKTRLYRLHGTRDLQFELFTQSVSPKVHVSLFHAGKACRHCDLGQNENPRQEARDPSGRTRLYRLHGTRGFILRYNMGSWSGAVCVASRTMLVTGRSVWNAQAVYRTTDRERQARVLRLYHVTSDPQELNDVAADPQHAPRTAELFRACSPCRRSWETNWICALHFLDNENETYGFADNSKCAHSRGTAGSCAPKRGPPISHARTSC